MPPHYPWHRVWVSRGSTVAITPDGFLDDPRAVLGSGAHPNPVPLSTLLHIPCLILLGEPGSGKTTELQRAYAAFPPVEDGRHVCLRFNLGSYGSATSLRRDIFDDSISRAWRDGVHTVALCLDGLDDGLARIPNLVDLLKHAFTKVDVQRMRVRIVCRTAMWPADLEVALRDLWRPADVQVYELTRLRRSDVHEAAACDGWDATPFLQALHAAGIGLLASSPVTLAVLMRIYRDQGTVPATQTALYRDGCRALCTEQGRQRQADRGTRSTPEQRYITAARLAASMVLGQRTTIWVGDPTATPSDAMPLHEFLDGTEIAHDNPFPITETVLHDTLDTGLFVSHDADRIGWVQSAYASFLAAEYLTRHAVSVPHIRSLIAQPAAGAWTIAPPLRQVAAWLAVLNPAISQELARADPDVLVESGMLDLSDRDRATVVAAVFARIAAERAPDLDRRLSRYGHTLTHPQLAQQVRPYLTDLQRPSEVQRAALDLVETGRLNDVHAEVVAFVLDAQRSHTLRVRAAQVLARLSDSPTTAQLRPLALSNDAHDPDHTLKGACLSVVWPRHLTLAELLATLVSSYVHHRGPYAWFLTSQFAPNLAPDDLAPALAWLEHQLEQPHPVAYLPDIEAALILQAWRMLDVSGVLPLVIRLALTHFSAYAALAQAVAGANDPARRRRLLAALIPQLTEEILDDTWITLPAYPWVQPDDLLWLIAQLQAAPTLATQRVILRFIRTIVTGPSHPDRAVLAEALRHPALQKLARRVTRTADAWMVIPPPEHAEPPAAEAAVSDAAAAAVRTEVTTLVQRCEAGATAQWWQIHDALLRPDATPALLQPRAFDPDLTTLPGWSLLDPALQRRVCLTAQQYLETQAPSADVGDWIDVPTCAGYWALRLLHDQLPAVASQLSAATWNTWVEVLTRYPLDWDCDATDADRALWDHAFAQVPEAWLAELHRALRWPTYTAWAPYLMAWATDHWDARVAAVFERSVHDPELEPALLGVCLALLFDHEHALAWRVAESLLVTPHPLESLDRERAVVAAQVVLTHTDDAGWRTVWPAIQQDRAFGCQVVASLLHRIDRTGVNPVVRLTDDQLTDLYVWIVDALDPDGPHAPLIGGWTRDQLDLWRIAIVSHLIERKAAPALDRLVRAVPDHGWLRTAARQAQPVVRADAWHPISHDQLRQLIIDT